MTPVQLAKELRRRLRAVAPLSEFVALAEALDISETGIDVDDASAVASLQVGATIEIDEELMRVTGISTNTLTVVRGWDETAAATHTSGTLTYVNPLYTLRDLQRLMVHEIKSWSPTIYAVHTVTVTVPASTRYADLGLVTDGHLTPFVILRAQRVKSTSDGYRDPAVRLVRDDAQFVTEGYGIELLDGTYSEATDLLVTVGTDFHTRAMVGEADWDASTDFEIDARLMDLLMWGTGARLLAGLVFNRAQLARQGESRHSEEVGAQELGVAVEYWQNQRDLALSAYAKWQSAQWPKRSMQ